MLQDEIIGEGEFNALSALQQTELIGSYCAPVMEQLSRVTGREEAVRIMDASCAAFDTRCHSSLLRQAVRFRITALLDERWGRG